MLTRIRLVADTNLVRANCFTTMLLPSEHYPVVLQTPDGHLQPLQNATDIAIFPGAFNPLHRGHQQLRRSAELVLQKPVFFELSLFNIDKGQLQAADLTKRLKQFSGQSVLLTNAPRFFDKSRLFPGCHFVVGFDTALRVLNPAYYNNQPRQMLAELNCFRSGGHQFLVGGRLHQRDANGAEFCQAGDLPVPDEFRDLFYGIDERTFREDISSTSLRQNSDTA